MALVVHIALALLFYLARTRFGPRPADPGDLSGKSLLLVYLASLVTIVIIPYALSAAICLRLHIHYDHSSLVLLLPHFYMLIIRKEILAFIQQNVTGKKK